MDVLLRVLAFEPNERCDTHHHKNYVFGVSTLPTSIDVYRQLFQDLVEKKLNYGRASRSENKPPQPFARSSEVRTSRSTRSPVRIASTISGTSATVTRP